MGKICDHTSVGILVWRGDSLLLIERRLGTIGMAPPAGHIDRDASAEEAAKRELKEEAGLDTRNLVLIAEGKKDNPCRREGGVWHYWKIFKADVEGEIARSEVETKQAGFYSKEEVGNFMERTEMYLAGDIKEEDWKDSPGIEPVWYEWFKELRII